MCEDDAVNPVKMWYNYTIPIRKGRWYDETQRHRRFDPIEVQRRTQAVGSQRRPSGGQNLVDEGVRAELLPAFRIFQLWRGARTEVHLWDKQKSPADHWTAVYDCRRKDPARWNLDYFWWNTGMPGGIEFSQVFQGKGKWIPCDLRAAPIISLQEPIRFLKLIFLCL